jgi:hypothetical protein
MGNQGLGLFRVYIEAQRHPCVHAPICDLGEYGGRLGHYAGTLLRTLYAVCSLSEPMGILVFGAVRRSADGRSFLKHSQIHMGLQGSLRCPYASSCTASKARIASKAHVGAEQ